MPIVDISPVGSKTEVRPTRAIPIYLVHTEDLAVTSGNCKYLAIKIDDLQNSIRLVGIETKEKEINIDKSYQEMINKADASVYIEIEIPWHRVIKIRNLSFKRKK